MSSSSRGQLPLLLLLLVIVWPSFSLDGAHAGNLPPTITSVDYTSTDDILLPAGTTLNVSSMLADAIANSKTEAVCTLIRTPFEGTLTITLPTTAAAWTTINNIPLRLLIQDGTSGTPRPTTYIIIAGVLALGSSITIEGGDFDYSNQFIDLPSGITIQDGSSLTVKGGAYRLHYPSSGIQSVFIRSMGAIIVNTTSTLAVYSSAMVVSNVSVSVSWQVYTIYSSSPITISNTSTLAVYSRAMVVSNVSVSVSWQVYTIYSSSSSPITISTTSTLAISNNTLVVSNLSVGSIWGVFTIFSSSFSSPITVSNTSTLAVYSSAMVVSNVSVGGYWQVYTIYSSSPITISTTSTLAVYNSGVEVSNVSVNGHWRVYTIYTTSPITISTTSTLAVYNSGVEVSNVSVNGYWQVYTIYTSTSPITISTTSTLAISFNSVRVLNVVRFPTYSLVRTSSTLLVDGALVISNNVVDAGGNGVALVFMELTSSLNGSGVVSLRRNTVVINAVGLMINVLGALGTSTPSIRTCDNYVDEVRCSVVATNYSCAGGVYLGGSLVDCGTHTSSHSASHNITQSLSASRRTLSHNGSLSLSQIQTPNRTVTTCATLCTQTGNAATTRSYSPPLVRSMSSTAPVAPTPPKTPSRTPLMPPCPSSAEPCPYSSTIIHGTPLGTGTTTVPNEQGGDCSAGGKGLSIIIPHSAWGGGSPFSVSVLLNGSLGAFFNPKESESAPFLSTSGDALRHTTHLMRDGNGGAVWAVAEVTYTGPSSRAAVRTTMAIHLPTYSFNCSFAVGSDVVAVPVAISMSMAESPVPDSIAVVMDVAVGVAVFGVVPSSLVRAGMMKTIIQSIVCIEFDPREEVGVVSNPLGWAVGRGVLQYYRGSVVTVQIAMATLFTCVLGVLVGVRVCGESVSTWGSAVDKLRLPSLLLLPLALLSEVAVSSAASILFFEDSDTVDRVLALAVLSPLFVYTGVYLYQTAVSSRYVSVEPVKGCTNVGFVRYALEPTHDVVLVHDSNRETNEDVRDAARCEMWLRRNFYFVTERRWAPFGGLELIGGTLANVLAGIPLTTTSRSLCIARPAFTLLIGIFLLLLLVRKSPNAVRLQQWCSLFVTGGMTLTSGLALANAISQSDGLEVATAYVGLVVVSISMILGLLDTLLQLMTYIPSLRTYLSLRTRGGLQSTLLRSKKRRDEEDALHVPMLVIPPDFTATSRGHSHPLAATATQAKGHDAVQCVSHAPPRQLSKDRDGRPCLPNKESTSSVKTPRRQSHHPANRAPQSRPREDAPRGEAGCSISDTEEDELALIIARVDAYDARRALEEAERRGDDDPTTDL